MTQSNPSRPKRSSSPPDPSPKVPPRPSFWIARLPASVFPRGPRALYSYMLAFPSGLCYLFNYRLASKFGVSLRTIHRWRAWLIKHHLIHTFWQAKNRPRIVVHRYASFYTWLTEMAIPKPSKKNRITPLSQPEKEARVRKMRRQLLGVSDKTPLKPVPHEPLSEDQTQARIQFLRNQLLHP